MNEENQRKKILLTGDTGWYYANFLWRLRGFIDLLVGGVGLRRGRKNPVTLHDGDPLDFWRVEVYEPDRRLRLAAEMKLPGRAWLEFEVNALSDNTFKIRQTAIFDPDGLGGLLYWHLLYPFHYLIFSGMLRNIAKANARLNGTLKPLTYSVSESDSPD